MKYHSDTMDKAKQKAEAVSRMRSLGIFEPIIRDFEDNDSVQCYEAPLGAAYWLPEKMKAVVKDFEKTYGALVYGVIKTLTPVGTMWAMLYVSAHQNEWQYDRGDLRMGQGYAYVYNESDPDLSEIGLIGFKQNAGGTLSRTW